MCRRIAAPFGLHAVEAVIPGEEVVIEVPAIRLRLGRQLREQQDKPTSRRKMALLDDLAAILSVGINTPIAMCATTTFVFAAASFPVHPQDCECFLRFVPSPVNS